MSYLLPAFALLFAAGADGFAPPARTRGDVTARLWVHVEDAAAPTGAAAVRLTLTVTGGPALEVEPPRLSDPLNAWEAKREDSRRPEGDRVVWMEVIELRQTKPGPAAPPDVTVRFRDAPGAPYEQAEWAGLLKMARDAPPPEAMPPLPTPSPWPAWLALAAAWAALAVMGFVLLRIRRRGRALPPDQAALRELTLLQNASLAADKGADYHARLSDVVRRYLAERFALPAPRRTTAEFLAMVRESNRLSPEQQALLREFLERCDLAKFAPARASPGQGGEAAALARAFVEQTAGSRF